MIVLRTGTKATRIHQAEWPAFWITRIPATGNSTQNAIATGTTAIPR
ncbi:hypothetical protein [Luteimicrobium album]|nr:hypothetical protein [Luteimicrobium album]